MNLKEKGRFFKFGAAITISGCLIILFHFLVYNGSDVGNGLGLLISAFAPFIVGIVLAYLMNPIQNALTKFFFKKFKVNAKSEEKALFKSKLFGMIICMLIIIGLVIGLFSLLIPSLIETATNLVNVLPKQISEAITWLKDNVVKTHPIWVERITNVLNGVVDSAITWAKESFLPTAGTLVSGLYTGVTGVISIVIDVVVGFVSCMYFLLDKENFIAQIKKTIVALFKPNTSKKILSVGTTAHKIFGGFINGKIITSLMVGIILFIAMLICGLPYAALSATIVGIMNIIPFFGPIIGAVPPAILILLNNPMQAVVFIALVIAVQGLDQYILSPRIIGNNTGLSSFWVMFAILVFGSLFGFAGMVLGVPVFALIYAYFSEFISKRLKKKDLPETTENYKNYAPYGIESISKEEKGKDESGKSNKKNK